MNSALPAQFLSCEPRNTEGGGGEGRLQVSGDKRKYFSWWQSMVETYTNNTLETLVKAEFLYQALLQNTGRATRMYRERRGSGNLPGC